MPCAVESERLVLGALLRGNAQAEIVFRELRSIDFFLPLHRAVFEQIRKLSEGGQRADVVLLSQTVPEELGGAAAIDALADLVAGMARVFDLEPHLRLLKEKAELRALVYAGQAALEGDVEAARAHVRAAQACTAVATEMFDSPDELRSTPGLRFAINGLLQREGVTMVGGLSGNSKTLFMLSLSKALLEGPERKLWGCFEVLVRAERVIYLIPECGRGPFAYRLNLFGLMPYVDAGRLLVRTLSKGPAPLLSDPAILAVAKGAYIFLDTAVRFGRGDEAEARDNNEGLATDAFRLLSEGAEAVAGAHHSPKSFEKERVMTLENMLRGTGDIGAMLSTAWGLRQIDRERNIVHIENLKPRDFEPCGPFQLIGRPHIDEEGDFAIWKRPGDCGRLSDEMEPERDRGGARSDAREAKAANLALLGEWLASNPSLTSTEIVERFKSKGIGINDSTVRHYRRQIWTEGEA